MEEIGLKLRTHLLNKRITDIEIYNINDSYYVFDPKDLWVFDGGIQIKFNKDIFSFGWNFENEVFDYSIKNTIDELIGEAPFYAVDAKQIEGISRIIGSHIIDVKIKWEYYQEVIELEIVKEDKIYVPKEVELRFNDDYYLQLALVDFEINEETLKMIDPKYSIEGELMLSLNKKIEITNGNST